MKRDYVRPLIEDVTSRLGGILCNKAITIAGSEYARGGTLTREREDLEEEEGDGGGWSTGGLW